LFVGSALQTLIQSAAGTGAPTNPSSRYLGAPVDKLTRPDGVQVAYLERRTIPQPDIYTSVQNYVVVDGDRLDNLAARFLGDPLLYWMICDANGVSDPEALTTQVGRTILIPMSSAIPSGVRNG
jgi:nucleoid-associated protein YgaU